MENAHRKYITDSKAVTVNATPYYLLRIRDKDLMPADEDTSTASADASTASAVEVPATPATDMQPKVPAAAATAMQPEVRVADQTADIAPADHNEVQ